MIASGSLVVPDSLDGAAQSRGLSRLGGVITSKTNSSGGNIVSAVGPISQNDIAPFVNSGLFKGEVNIISGVHGDLAEGVLSSRIDKSLFLDDLDRFGDIPGVNVLNLPDLTPQQINKLLDTPDTTIGAFCNSGNCLLPFE